MRYCHRQVVFAVIVCLISMHSEGWATTVQAAPLPNPALERQRLERFGAGAPVKLKLVESGEKVRGSVGAIEESGFDLIPDRGSSPRRIRYDQLAELRLAKSTYRAAGAPNPEEARRIAAGLGVGRHVVVKVAPGRTFRGNLQAIGDDRFVLLPDRKAQTVEIAYGDVQALGPNLSKGMKIAIVVGVIGAVTVAIVAASGGYSSSSGSGTPY